MSKPSKPGERSAVPSTGLLDSVLEGLPNPVFVKDEAHRWVLLNTAFCEFMGFAREVLLGKSDHDFFPAAEAEVFWRKDDEVFATGRLVENEESFTDSAGRTHVIITRKTLHVDEQGRRFLIGVITDITELRQALTDLRRSHDELEVKVRERTAELQEANQRLQQQDAHRNAFLNTLSHELRNPLAAIRNAGYLLDHAPGEGAPAQRAQEVLRRQSEHLTRLVDDLLDVARVTHGKIDLHRSIVDAGVNVSETCDAFRPVFERVGVALDCGPPAGAAWIEVDPTRFAQALGNLLHNAVKFTPAGGRVSVTLATSGDRAQIRLADTGIGMHPRDIERLFEPFAQATTTARAHGGLGVGLSLVKGLVEAQGGTVHARSAGPGHGSEFTLEFPLAPPPAGPFASGAAPGNAPARRIIVVDDDPDNAETLAEVLRLQGHEVHQALSGLDGLELAREVKPEIVICDIGLQDLSGYELARRVRADPALRDVHLVALTGYAQPEDRARALSQGFEAYLAKPPRFEELNDVLARLGPPSPPAAPDPARPPRP